MEKSDILKRKKRSKYKMKNYFENVRITLKNKEIHVPKKQKFHEVRERKWNFLSDTNISTFYWTMYALSIILVFISIFSRDSEYVQILYTLTAISCSISLILSLVFKEYRIWFYVCLWIANSIIWIFNTISIF